MRKALLLAASVFFIIQTSFSQTFTYSFPQHEQGMKLMESSPGHISVTWSIYQWSMDDISINRDTLKKIDLPGSFLPNDEGAPDVPSKSRYIAIPHGATPRLNVHYSVVEVMHNVDLSPAPRIPKTTENGPLVYQKDGAIWSQDAFYPEQPVKLSSPTNIRGLDVVMLGITPFQYNPVTKELKIYRDLEVEITFEGGDGLFGDERLRSRFWDPLIEDAVMNPEMLPAINYSAKLDNAISKINEEKKAGRGSRSIGCEYLIIVPDDSVFISWADTISLFRNRQGILTEVMTTTDLGGNTVSSIESFIDSAYYNWDIVPAAVLLLGDYGTGNSGIVSPIWDDYCVSDNIYADVTNNDMPDIVFSRIAAQNATHLETMIHKFIDYETDPYTDPEYYNHPITALGWQTERWFQVCIEVVGGFFRNELGKDPVRINEVYDGNPAVDPWSTAPNTGTIMNYFGPNGLDYIPATPEELGSWNGGSANDINDAINDGSFLLLHRDHGFEQGWGEPSYSNGNLSGLDNDKLTFVYSVNCLTGKYNWGGECFAEAFHRYPKRALGLIAASEVSYSFVNDTYVWGAFDNMWPEFMPDYGSTPEPRGLYPSFSNAAGKYFLQQSSWPYNGNNKEVTYNLFHHFGDAFNELYSEVPQDLVVVHNGVILGQDTNFTIQADEGSWIALSVDGEIIGVAEGTGEPVDVTIIPQIPGTAVDLVVTKTNHFRHEEAIDVISPNAPYVIYSSYEMNDDNGNGMMEYHESATLSLEVQNIGLVDAAGLTVTLSSADPFIEITDSTEYYGNLPGGESLLIADGFAFNVSDTIPDGHMVFFDVACSDGDTTWTSQFTVTGHAPVMEYVSFSIDDSNGDGNGRIDPGETVSVTVIIRNGGSSEAFNASANLVSTDQYMTVLSGLQTAGDMAPGDTFEAVYDIMAEETTPGGFNAFIGVDMSADFNISGYDEFSSIIGQYTALVLDLDPINFSAPLIYETFEDMDIGAEYRTSFPDDFNSYKTVFICLGIYFNNHVLTNNESLVLEEFLNNGGKLYMEGRPTWYDDPQTTVHSMFNVEAILDYWFLYDSIYGQDGTFSEGMKFKFNGPNNFNRYHLEPIPPAYSVLTSDPYEKSCMVANDAGDYKTVACSMDFGSLVDGEPPSTREQLMLGILDFFGGILTDIPDGNMKDAGTHVTVYPNPCTNSTSFTLNLQENSRVSLEIFSMTGEKIRTVFDGSMVKGIHHLNWSIDGLAQGMYFYRLSSSTGCVTGKLIRKL